MDFEKILKLLIADFNKEEIRYALIGGFGMGLLGVARATIDLDFLIAREDIPKIDIVMKKYGYRRVFHSENVSQYNSDIGVFGSIDFLHAFRVHSLNMLDRAQEKNAFGGKLTVKVLCPEDIIGLKIQAAVNDPARETREFSDIEGIMQVYKHCLDWDLLREYFAIFEKNAKYDELKMKYEKYDQ